MAWPMRGSRRTWRPRWTPPGWALRLAAGRFAPFVLAAVAVAVSVVALLPQPAEISGPQRTDFVIVVGAAGLRWEDIDETRTPTLWSLAESGAIGALSVESADEVTCPADGWLTLGAGNLAQRTSGPVNGQCPDLAVEVEQTAGDVATVTDQQEIAALNRELSWDVQPGALAEAVRCTTAIGSGAAIAAARPYGRVDRYSETIDDGLEGDLKACSLSMVDAGTVSGSGSQRYASAQVVDAALAAVLAARPDRSLVIVAGLSDTADTERLHVAIASGPGYGQGWLVSSATNRPGYVQLVDLAPTVLEALGRPIPEDLFSGAAVTRSGDRPESLTVAVDSLADADQQASVQRVVAARFLIGLAIGQILLFVLVTPVLRRARQWSGQMSSPPYDRMGRALNRPPRRILIVTEVALIAASIAVPAALVTDLVPWWRWPWPNAVFLVVTSAVLAGATAVLVALIRRWRTMGPLRLGAAVGAMAVAADVMTGSRLQLNGVAGYSATSGGRYAGLGIIGLGVLVGGTLLLAGALATGVPRRWRPSVVAAVGALGIVVVGSPYLGADATGAVALSAGVCLAAAASSGGWFTASRIVWSLITAAAVTTGFALLDLTRTESQRGNIGRFLVDLGDNSLQSALDGQSLGEHNVTTTATSPLTLLVLGASVFMWFVLLRPSGGLHRLFGLYPAIRATLGGMVVATLFAGLAEGAGLNVLGAAVATVLPLVILGVLRVLNHADDRTQPDEQGRQATGRDDTAPQVMPPSGKVLA